MAPIQGLNSTEQARMTEGAASGKIHLRVQVAEGTHYPPDARLPYHTELRPSLDSGQ